MANNPVDPGRGQPLRAFERETASAKKVSRKKHDHLLFRGYAANELESADTSKHDPKFIAEQQINNDLEVSEVVAELFGGSDGQLGRVGTLEAISNQADYLAVKHRATTLRHTNLIRRIAHAAARRHAYHRDKDGYVDKRLVKTTREKLREAMS